MADPDTTPDHTRGQTVINGRVVTVPADLPPPDMKGLQVSNAQLQEAEAKGELPRLGNEPGAHKEADAKLAATVADVARRMGLSEAPPIYVPAGRSDGLPVVGSGETREGKPYIVMDENAQRLFTPEQQAAVAAFETDRIKHRDSSPANVANIQDPKTADARTFEADRSAAGPDGTCNPDALAAALRIGEGLRLQGLKAAGEQHPGPDPEHPHVKLRLDRLAEQKQAQDASGICRGR